jgi:hypothetical protein
MEEIIYLSPRKGKEVWPAYRHIHFHWFISAILVWSYPPSDHQHKVLINQATIKTKQYFSELKGLGEAAHAHQV